MEKILVWLFCLSLSLQFKLCKTIKESKQMKNN